MLGIIICTSNHGPEYPAGSLSGYSRGDYYGSRDRGIHVLAGSIHLDGWRYPYGRECMDHTVKYCGTSGVSAADLTVHENTVWIQTLSSITGKKCTNNTQQIIYFSRTRVESHSVGNFFYREPPCRVVLGYIQKMGSRYSSIYDSASFFPHFHRQSGVHLKASSSRLTWSMQAASNGSNGVDWLVRLRRNLDCRSMRVHVSGGLWVGLPC